MSFDLSEALAPALNDGAFMHMNGPDGQPLYDEDKVPVGVTLRGRYSTHGLAAMRANGNRRLDQVRQTGSSNMTVETGEAELVDLLVACTVGWTFDTIGGEAFPFTLENARKFWSDDRFRRWRMQAEDFFANEANFMKG